MMISFMMGCYDDEYSEEGKENLQDPRRSVTREFRESGWRHELLKTNHAKDLRFPDAGDEKPGHISIVVADIVR